MFDRFTSRKFIMAVASFIAFILATAGVIDPSTTAQVATVLGPMAYILVEGLVDYRATAERIDGPALP